MNSHRHIRIPSALGAILAATLMTLISTAPEAVHANDTVQATCVETAHSDFAPVPSPILL